MKNLVSRICIVIASAAIMLMAVAVIVAVHITKIVIRIRTRFSGRGLIIEKEDSTGDSLIDKRALIPTKTH